MAKIGSMLGLKVGKNRWWKYGVRWDWRWVKQVAKIRNTLGLMVGITSGENTEYAETEGG